MPVNGDTPRVDDAVLNERRLAALRRVALLDTPAEEAFDRLTRAACLILDVPVALVSLVDSGRQFFKSCVGLPEPYATTRETPLSHSFCQHTIASGEPLIVSDAREHPVVRENLAVRDLSVIAYAGIPLRTTDGFVIGSFCAIGHEPRVWSGNDVLILTELAGSAMTIIELRAQALDLDETREERDRVNERLILTQARERAERERHLADMVEVSERLQRELLPTLAPLTMACSIDTFYQPGGRTLLIGGDFFDAIEHGDAVHFVLADVAGHGPEAAAFAVGLRAAWVALQEQDPDPGVLLARLNRVALRERRENSMFITALAGRYECGTRRLEIATAGHPWPLQLHDGRAAEVGLTGGPALGLLEHSGWTTTATTLPEGASLLAFTDGITEGRVAPGAVERTGTPALQRWAELLQPQFPDGSELLEALHDAATVANGGVLPDDVAMLLLTPT
ncbi:GAF domain-containing SpoIIE family protein phosphatase [Paraconexibacter sp. AEG42_29]